MPRLKFQSPKDELIYRVWQFVRGKHPYGLAEARLRYSALRFLAAQLNVPWPGDEKDIIREIAPIVIPAAEPAKVEEPKPVRNIRTELEGRV